jgi:hypothetical protein
MGDNRTVYERPEGQTTQWEDIQRKMGNMAPAEKVWKPAAWEAKRELPRGLTALIGGGSGKSGDADALGDLEGEFDDDRFLEEYRLKRLAELREKEEKASSQGKRGVVATISKEEYVAKVTRASAGVDPDNAFVSATNEEEEDDEDEDAGPSSSLGPKPTSPPRWIVCHMFREGVTSCDDVDDALRQLADSPAASAPAATTSTSTSSSSTSTSTKPFPRVSFVRIRADDVAPGYPASALPTLLVYFGGECVASLKGKDAFSGVGIGGGSSKKDEDEKRSSYSKTPRDAGRLSTSAVVSALEGAAPGILMGAGKKKGRKSGNESDNGGSDSE